MAITQIIIKEGSRIAIINFIEERRFREVQDENKKPN